MNVIDQAISKYGYRQIDNDIEQNDRYEYKNNHICI